MSIGISLGMGLGRSGYGAGGNPILFLATLDNTLAGQNRAGVLTLTSAGALRYADSSYAGSKAAWIEEATTNLIRNPSAELSTGDSASRASATITRDTTTGAVGTASYKAVTPGSVINEGFQLNSAPSLGLTGSARVFAPSCSVKGSGTVAVFGQIIYTDASNTTGTATTVPLTGTFQRVTPAILTANAAKTVDQIRLFVWTPTTQAITFWVDGCQIEEKAQATSYCDGTLGTGYTWSGTAHGSTSSRDAATLTIPGTIAPTSISYHYSEDNGATWQTGYRSGVGALGTNGLMAVSGSDLLISTTRSLQIGPVAGYDRTLTAGEQATLAATDPADWWGALG